MNGVVLKEADALEAVDARGRLRTWFAADPRRAPAAILSILLGLMVIGAAFLHTVGVTNVAFSERDGYDKRLGTLLVVGVCIATAGLLLVLGGLGTARRVPRAPWFSMMGASAMFLNSLVLAPVIGSFWTGIFVTGAFLVVFPWLLRRRAWKSRPTSRRAVRERP